MAAVLIGVGILLTVLGLLAVGRAPREDGEVKEALEALVDLLEADAASHGGRSDGPYDVPNVDPDPSPDVRAGPADASAPQPPTNDTPREPVHEAQADLDIRRQMVALARAGTPVKEIARQVGRPVGEVEVVVGLSRVFKAKAPGWNDRAPTENEER